MNHPPAEHHPRHHHHQYQPMPQADRSRGRKSNNEGAVVREEPVYQTDEQFYNNLDHYSPMCYSGQGQPRFMINKNWYLSLACLIIINGLFALVLVFFINGSKTGMNPMSDADVNKYLIINLTVLILTNITYFLTQFLNPGVRNLSSIQQWQYEQQGKEYCMVCRGYRTKEMEHCKECGVCVEGLDHHCGFFSKCIAGCQIYAFYAFLTMMFSSFLTMLVTMSANVGL